MMNKIVIIGGGVAGLSAGIFAQKNGFKSTIIEKHHTAGGECTGWDRQGYHIDGCIHWLVGTKEGTPLRELWDTVGALEGVEIHEPESFIAVEHEGITVYFYRDLDRLKSSWLEISPQDKEAIEEFCGDIRKLHKFTFTVGKPLDMMSIIEKFKYMLTMNDIGPVMQKYSKLRVQDLAGKFKHPALKEALASFMPKGDYSAVSIIFPLGTFTGGQSSIPLGGSRSLARRMEEKYLALGGNIETSCEVMELEINKDSVRRVTCSNGKSFAADYFIAACDANMLYEKLLKGQYPDPEFKKRFSDPGTYPLASNIYVGVGYAGSMRDIPRTPQFPVGSIDIEQNQAPTEYLQMTHYSYEPDFAPKGHTAVTFAINQFQPELEKWEALVQDREAYNKEKNRIGEEVVSALETRFPEMTGKLKLLDVASPQTYERYCNAYRGAFMAFWPTLKGKQLAHDGQIRGLDNLVLSGQWLQPPGGLPVALITGKDTILRLCRKVKKELPYRKKGLARWY